MRTLALEEIQNVNGAFFFLLAEAILIGVGIFAAPKIIKDSNDYLNGVGHNVGEATWEHFHPYDPNK